LLREQAGEDTGGLGEWWTGFQELSMDERLAQAPAAKGSRSGRRGRKRHSQDQE